VTPATVYLAACELAAQAALLADLLRPAGEGLAAPLCPHPPEAREPRGTLAARWRKFFCRDCQREVTVDHP
jgi:hypothetical protein